MINNNFDNWLLTGIPLMPGRPGGPRSPSSPFSPLKPCSPRSPFGPGSPFVPATKSGINNVLREGRNKYQEVQVE